MWILEILLTIYIVVGVIGFLWIVDYNRRVGQNRPIMRALGSAIIWPLAIKPIYKLYRSVNKLFGRDVKYGKL